MWVMLGQYYMGLIDTTDTAIIFSICTMTQNKQQGGNISFATNLFRSRRPVRHKPTRLGVQLHPGEQYIQKGMEG